MKFLPIYLKAESSLGLDPSQLAASYSQLT
jgi:hypothetical protein